MNTQKIERLREAAKEVNLPEGTKEDMIRNAEELWKMTYEEQIMRFQLQLQSTLFYKCWY